MKSKKIRKILTGVGLLIVAGFLLVVVGFLLVKVFDTDGVARTDSHSVEQGDAETVRAEISMEMGQLEISGGADNLMSADLTYKAAEWKPVVEYSLSEDQGTLAVQPPESQGLPPYKAGYDWDLRLNNDVPIDLNVALNMGKATLHLGGLSLSALEVMSGTSDVTVDLTGNWRNDFTARIWGGIGRTTIQLPDEVGVIVDVGGNANVYASGLIRGGNTYVNTVFGESEVTLSIDIVTAGFGEINLEVEGAPATGEAHVVTCADVNILADLAGLADRNLPHTAEDRLTQTVDFYKEDTDGYGFGKLHGYGQGQVDFTQWEVRRGALDPETGSPWWRAVNGQLIRDMLEARYLFEAGLTTCAGSSEAVDAWLAYLVQPSPQSWYLAHNRSIVLGYLTHEDLASRRVSPSRW